MIKSFKRYSYYDKVIISEDKNHKIVVKKTDKNISELFIYLKNKDFNNIPNIINNYNNEIVYEYINEDYIISSQKYNELIKIIGLLHSKTVYFKETSIDNYKEIKEIIQSNINHLKMYYESVFLRIIKTEYHSPNEYLFSRNYYKISEVLKFCQDELTNWFNMVKDIKKQRVCIIHNNLSIDHFIYNKKSSVLISWDNYKVDTPILDFIGLYKKEYKNIEFSNLLEEYLAYFSLLESEQKLLFIILSIPPKIEINNKGIESIIKTHDLIEYIFKTEELIRPYYSKQEVKKE